MCLGVLVILATARIWSMPLVYDDAWWLETSGATWSLDTAPFHVGLLLSGGLPWGPRLVLITLHLLNGALVWGIARRWLSPIATALVLVLCWLHPLPLQAVFYLTGGREVWVSTLALLAIAAGLRTGVAGWIGACVALTLAILIKPSALPLLVAVPLVWIYVARLTDLARLGLAAIVSGTLLVIPLDAVDRQAIAAWALSLWRYVGLALWPAGFSLLHDWSAVPSSVACFAVGVIVVIGLLASRVARPVWFAWLWMVLLTAPRALIRQAPPLTEAQMYLPALALWMLAGWSADRWLLKECHG